MEVIYLVVTVVVVGLMLVQRLEMEQALQEHQDVIDQMLELAESTSKWMEAQGKMWNGQQIANMATAYHMKKCKMRHDPPVNVEDVANDINKELKKQMDNGRGYI